MSFLRLLLAALLVLGGLLLVVILLGPLLEERSTALPAKVLMLVSFFVLLAVVMFLFNPGVRYRSDEDFIRSLEEHDLLAVDRFTARRAFQVEEFEDEGLH